MPYWRISGFYFFYFATLGALVPYWGLYLQSIGFSAFDIGLLMALLLVSRIVAPLLWAWLADHSGARMRVVRLAAFLTVIAFAGAFLGTTFWWLAAVMLVFSFFWNASLPMLEVATMNHLDGHAGGYGKVRLWGSLGFIASVLALGPVIDARGPWWVLPALLSLVIGIWLFSMMIPEREAADPAPHPEPFLKVIMQPRILVFLVACFLMQASHGPYYTFYSIYLEDHGYAKSLIGVLWALGVVCEIGVFLIMSRLMAALPLRTIFLASFALAALRWLLIGYYPDQLAILICAQVLHAATFGTFHASAMQMVHRLFTGRHQHRGQAVYGSASFGLGGALGSLYSGYTWDTLGPDVSFAIAGGLALLAFALVWVWLPKGRMEQS
jgi:PPP family 3-phenylpropionic acid transporter